MELKQFLLENSACKTALNWVDENSIRTVEEAVIKCERADWLIWLGNALDLPRKDIVNALCKCVDSIRHLLSVDAEWGLDLAIKWCSGGVDLKDIKKEALNMSVVLQTIENTTYPSNYNYNADKSVRALLRFIYHGYLHYSDYCIWDCALAVADKAHLSNPQTIDPEEAQLLQEQKMANICRECLGQDIIFKFNNQ